MAINMHKAIFIDKDGTLIQNIPYSANSEEIQLIPSAGHGLFLLSQYGYKLFVVTNQSAIARGVFTEKNLKNVYQKIQSLLAEFHVQLDGFYYCPHHPDGLIKEYTRACVCRKPSPGLLLQAATRHSIDLSSSWMIGDILTDTEAGNRAECKTILFNNGGETEWLLSPANAPYYVATKFDQITQVILFSEKFTNKF